MFLYVIVHFAVQSLYQESASFYLLLKKNIYNSLTAVSITYYFLDPDDFLKFMKKFQLQLLNGKLTLRFDTEQRKTCYEHVTLYELSNSTGRNLDSGLHAAKK